MLLRLVEKNVREHCDFDFSTLTCFAIFPTVLEEKRDCEQSTDIQQWNNCSNRQNFPVFQSYRKG